jgi:hypothetical protein
MNGRAVVQFANGGGSIWRPTEKIGNGARCPLNLYEKMRESWNPVPNRRPFRDLVRFLRTLCRWKQQAYS